MISTAVAHNVDCDGTVVRWYGSTVVRWYGATVVWCHRDAGYNPSAICVMILSMYFTYQMVAFCIIKGVCIHLPKDMPIIVFINARPSHNYMFYHISFTWGYAT